MFARFLRSTGFERVMRVQRREEERPGRRWLTTTTTTTVYAAGMYDEKQRAKRRAKIHDS